MKNEEHQHKRNLTAWVSEVQYDLWDAIRRKESANPDRPAGWSGWIARNVNAALNADKLQIESTTTDSAETAHLHRQIVKLQDRIRELEAREIGVSDTRILRILSSEYMDFNNIVQKLIDTEAEAAYQTVQRLAADGEVACDDSGMRWRLSDESV